MDTPELFFSDDYWAESLVDKRPTTGFCVLLRGTLLS